MPWGRDLLVMLTLLSPLPGVQAPEQPTASLQHIINSPRVDGKSACRTFGLGPICIHLLLLLHARLNLAGYQQATTGELRNHPRPHKERRINKGPTRYHPPVCPSCLHQTVSFQIGRNMKSSTPQNAAASPPDQHWIRIILCNLRSTRSSTLKFFSCAIVLFMNARYRPHHPFGRG